ncbi:MAG: C25 family cysteine peptidase [Pyrinomonadaceae bacterium]
MRKTVSLALLLTLALASVLPTLAQRGGDDRIKVSTRTAFDNARALTDGAGVLIRWQMKVENSVAGYNVYRISSGGREIVTPRILIGSSGRYGTRPAYGEEYSFFDTTGRPGSVYVVEGLAMSGGRFTSKEITAISVKSLEAEVGTSSQTYIDAANSTNSNIEERTSVLSGELQDLVSLYEQEPDPVNQIWVAAQPGAKIAVKKDGFYRVTAAELQSANFPVNSDSSKWRMFMNGREQAIIVGAGGQYVEFYGKAVDTAETDTRVYYLISDTVAGKRIGSKVLRQIPGAASAANYAVVGLKKQRTTYIDLLFNGDEENYVGDLFADAPKRIPFNLSGVDFTIPTAEIKINIRGWSNNPHQVLARLNGFELPLITQFGQVFYSGTFTVPTSHLLEGANEIELSSHNAGDYNLFDNVSVSYSRKYVADQNKISFSAPGSRKIDIAGFSTSNVRVFDMTFDGNPVLISNVSVASSGSEFIAKIPSSRMMVGYAIEDSALLQAGAITENLPSSLSGTANDADMLIISYSSSPFMNAAEAWAAYRRTGDGGRHTVKVIDIADIYDEFSYGRVGYEPVKAFLEHASTEWTTHPGYALFLGDSTRDMRHYEQPSPYLNLIPSHPVSLILQESFSDDALGDFDDDGLSDMAIGRIPAQTAAQVSAAFNKTVRYEAAQQSFSRGVLFAHDVPLGYDFEGMNQQLSALLPPGTPVSVVSAGEADAHPNLVARQNEGKFLINYSGHGATGLWANSGFFNLNSVPELTNANNPSVYSMLTCMNGYFVLPNGDSLSESLLFSPTGGAAAAWASTSETTPDIQLIMAIRFFETMSTGNIHTIGDLVKDAKTVLDQGADVKLSWVLLGDPAMKLP